MGPDEARKRFVGQFDHVEPAVREAMAAVPRHEFVPETYRPYAYEDRPLPIGEGATISAPGIVAEMVDHLALDPDDRVLEIGTGSGYHAAVVAEVVGPGNVHSVEYDPDLAEEARTRLADLGYEISIRVGDGREGWPEHAPYDGIYLTCAVRDLPPALVEQLRPGGLLLAPLGIADQRLTLVRKDADGNLDRLDCGPVQFVTMQGPDVSRRRLEDQ